MTSPRTRGARSARSVSPAETLRTARSWSWSLSWLLICAALSLAGPERAYTASVASDAFDCRSVTAGGKTFDLSSLSSRAQTSKLEHTPPTTTRTTLSVSLCSALAHDPKLPDVDQCPAGTRVCMVVENLKEKAEDRVVQVVPLAGDVDGKGVRWEAGLGEREEEMKEAPLQLTLRGSEYAGKPQRAKIEFVCDPKAAEDTLPTMGKYDDGDGELRVKWSTRHVCGTSGGHRGDGGEKSGSEGGSSEGWGFLSWFFFVLFSGLAVYLGGGMYQSYSRYGARGWDLIPHRDFWRESVYVGKEMVTQVYRSVGGGQGRGAYEAV